MKRPGILTTLGLTVVAVSAVAGVGDPDIDDGHSRAFTVFNDLPAPPGPPLAIEDAHSRGFTVFNDLPAPPGAGLVIEDAHSRAFTVFNDLLPPPGPPLAIEDAHSRAFTVCNGIGFVDDDQDGIHDCDDACPGFDDSLDMDSDAVPDACDNCPEDPNPDQADCDNDGLGDVCAIAGGLSEDCNFNGIPDECEPDEDCNTNGIQDICDIAEMTSDDCNLNSIPDDCDIADGTSQDCNLNGIPDECELAGNDCNNNGVPDECDTPICGDGCIMSGEECDDGGTDDADGCSSGCAVEPGWVCTGEPSVCITSPLPEDSLGVTNCVDDGACTNEAYCVPDTTGAFPGICYVPKNRYVSVAPNPGNIVPTARRLSVVTFERSCGGAGNTPCTRNAECVGSPDGTTCDDVRVGSQVLGWFGPPDADGYVGVVDEASRHYTIWADLTFPMECGVGELCPAGAHCDVGLGASNTCRWDADDTQVPTAVVQLTDCHISPKKRDVRPLSAGGLEENRAANYYLIEPIVEGSDISAPSNYSTPLELRTVIVWGDMTGGTQNNVALPPDNSPGFLDILHQVNRFKDKGKATTAWLDLDPQVPDHGVGFLDMLQGVNGFKNQPYPFVDPCSCAGLAPCE